MDAVVVGLVGVFAICLHLSNGDSYIDGSKGLQRHSEHGLAYANFVLHKFRYLNITPLISASVKDIQQCGRFCVAHFSCFSINFAAFFTEEGRILCEVLPSDKYKNSDNFLNSEAFHHLSIKVSKNKWQNIEWLRKSKQLFSLRVLPFRPAKNQFRNREMLRDLPVRTRLRAVRPFVVKELLVDLKMKKFTPFRFIIASAL